MRVATWNVNSLKARLQRVESWLDKWQPDIVCLQETKLADDAFPALTFEAMGYSHVHHGQGRWNGVAILFKGEAAEVRYGPDGSDGGEASDAEEARLVFASVAGVRVGSVYVPNGRALDDDQFAYKLAFLERLRRLLEAEIAEHEEVILCGDFNIAPEDRDVWDPKAFEGATHVSEAERAAFRSLEEVGTSDLFRQLHDIGGLYTWWDYRSGNFHKRKGMRIDHMLASAPLEKRLEFMLVDRTERTPKGNPAGGAPSDHAPLLADFDD